MSERREAEHPSKIEPIGSGSCGTVWARRGGRTVFKDELCAQERSLKNELRMHKHVISTFLDLELMKYLVFEDEKLPLPQVQIPKCYGYIKSTNQKWWNKNLELFPSGFVPCNLIKSERIVSFPGATKNRLVKNFCPPEIIESCMMTNKADTECLIRPYLGRCRSQELAAKSDKQTFSLRNFPLHQDQMKEIGITEGDMNRYAGVMGETLSVMHWMAEVDGRDVEFVLAPAGARELCQRDIIRNALGEHCMWILDFDQCQAISMDIEGVCRAADAFWWNHPFMPHPDANSSLWKAFRQQYLKTSWDAFILPPGKDGVSRFEMASGFIYLVEAEGLKRAEGDEREKEEASRKNEEASLVKEEASQEKETEV